MRVLLINPPFERLMGIAHIYFPLGLGYLCASLARSNGVDTMVYNAEIPGRAECLPFHVRYAEMMRLHDKYIDALRNDAHLVWQEMRELISGFAPDMVGITVLTAKYGAALKVSEIVKLLLPNCRIVWGGPHATIDPQRILKNKEVDFVIRGEGEATLNELIFFLKSNGKFSCEKLRDITGLSFRENLSVCHNPDRGMIEDLDDLPVPDRKRVFFRERYLPYAWGDVITSRGCPFLCGYCGAHNTWTKRVRYREVEKVIHEIQNSKTVYGTNQFYFWDDSFTLKKARIIEFCGLLIKCSLDIRWGCTTRADLLDEELLIIMKRTGCNFISIGVETGSERMLDNIHKGITLDDVVSVASILNRHKMDYELFFMIGFPDETVNDIRQTFDFMKRMKQAKICLSVFTPYPGTEQYAIAKGAGLVDDDPDWSRFSHHSRDNHFMKYVQKNEFVDILKEITDWVDRHNTRNMNIVRLAKSALKDLPGLIKNPGLFFYKIKTFFVLIRHKVNNVLSFCRGE